MTIHSDNSSFLLGVYISQKELPLKHSTYLSLSKYEISKKNQNFESKELFRIRLLVASMSKRQTLLNRNPACTGFRWVSAIVIDVTNQYIDSIRSS